MPSPSFWTRFEKYFFGTYETRLPLGAVLLCVIGVEDCATAPGLSISTIKVYFYLKGIYTDSVILYMMSGKTIIVFK